jgi:hypothetical protein
MSQDLTRLFLPPNFGVGLPAWQQATCTAWDPTTSQSVVNVGGVAVYTNAPILAAALATMTTGPVLIAFADGGPIILGRLVIPTSTV